MNKTITTLSIAAATLIGANTASAYEVKSGDTLGAIANDHAVPLKYVIEANPHISNPNVIFPKDSIHIPNGSVQNVQKAPVTASEPVGKVNGSISSNERDLLARLVRAEATGESFEGKKAVAEVVLNRVKDDQFPNTITGVIYQPNQFVPAHNGMMDKAATKEDFAAVDAALSGSSDGSLYFYNANIVHSPWLNARPTVKAIGNHVFKK